MKIAIFENEYGSVKGAFESANFFYFEGKLTFENFASSQKANLASMSNYAVIFVDIDLSSKSELDGFSLIEKIVEINSDLVSRIVILTGNNRIKEIMPKNSIFDNIEIHFKPTDFDRIAKSLQSVIDSNIG